MRPPTLFIAHGSPINLVEDNVYTRDMRAFAKTLTRPRGIIIFSAHWTTHLRTLVTSAIRPRQIYDFAGFPPEVTSLRYEPLGDPQLAARVVELLGVDADLDPNRGIDHAGWSVGYFLFPEADVPMISVSVRIDLEFSEYVAIGQRLQVLRDEGYLIIGSGNIAHNLMEASFDEGSPAHILAQEFHDRIKYHLLRGDRASILAMKDSREYAFSVPTIEHFAPFLMAMGAA